MDIGPALPPHLRKAAQADGREDEEGAQIGPQLPKRKQQEDSRTSGGPDEGDMYGPTLPPGFQKKTRCIGPTLPQGARESAVEDDDESIIGPMPASATDTAALLMRTKWDFESRSQAKKDQMTGKKEEKMQRESWMTELPPELSKNFGLGPRTFRAHAPEIGDRSVWTDTPSDKAKKDASKTKQEGKTVKTSERTPWELERDKELSRQVEAHNKRSRGESLLDMHKKKIKKQKEEQTDKVPERRPFDREVDLAGPNLMDSNKRKSVIDKSKKLGSRFQHASGGSSFL